MPPPKIAMISPGATGPARKLAPLVTPATVIAGCGLGTVNSTFPRDVGGVEVLFDGVPAPILYASSSQVSVTVPYALDGKPQTVLLLQYAGL